MTTYTIEDARRLLKVVDAGLCSGLGEPVPGQMCVEAAVCYALGEPHGDEPSCVAPAVRRFKIRLNDARWSSNAARAAGMRALAVAQLGSKDTVDELAFVRRVAELTIREILPPVLRRRGLDAAAERCEQEGTADAARAAVAAYADADHAADAAAAAYAYADAADAADADAVLRQSADTALRALRELGAPGVTLWDEVSAAL